MCGTSECSAVTFSMSGNCDFPCRQVNQYIIQICKCNCTAVPTPSHITGVTLQTDKALILCTSIGNITCSDYQIFKVTLLLLQIIIIIILGTSHIIQKVLQCEA